MVRYVRYLLCKSFYHASIKPNFSCLFFLIFTKLLYIFCSFPSFFYFLNNRPFTYISFLKVFPIMLLFSTPLLHLISV